MRIYSIILSGILGLLSLGPAHAGNASPDAILERWDPASATLSLTREGDDWRLRFRAAGLPNGAATAVDCEIEAVGTLDRDDIIAARVVPFEGELTSVTASDIGTKDLIIHVQLGPEGAIATDSGAALHLCALGSDIDGFYRDTDTPE